ncbi:MAG: Mur ligase family protein [Candidatus Shapirobacteria bacterium]|nr:Mur ligase family protein [Candidatus Shapirobacteria bacterium]MDD4410273.1 Mur ligase family protein [Candidatus Shapirobacteria bacterium]
MKQKISLFILYYLRFFAKLQLSKVKFLQKIKGKQLDIIGITGSAGKSSALIACQSVFPKKYKIKTNNNCNSESGLPLSILGLKLNDYNFFAWFKMLILSPLKYLINWQSYDILILEMGIDSASWPKNMDYLLSVVKPNIAIFLNVSPVHLDKFNSLDQIAGEKAKLVNQAKIAIINNQDKLVKKYTQNKNIINLTPTKIRFDNFYLPDIYQVSFGAALSLAQIFNINYNEAVKNIQDNFSLPPSRSSILEGIKNTTIIDSSYNSSPIACSELLKFLSSFKSKKIAVLGDMRELGDATPEEHRKIYDQALKSADLIISVGPETSKYFGDKTQKFVNWWTAAEFLKETITGCETILVKGSQNTIFLEELVKSILKNPSDVYRICRQSKFWLKTKSNYRSKANLA